MQACRSHNETLMLDVFGEIADPGARRVWEAHLKACAGCRLEKQRMAGLVANLKAAGSPPELAPARAQAMAARTRRALAGQAQSGAPRSRWKLMGRPALAGACALVVISVAGYLAQDWLLWPARIAGLSSETQPPEQDLDVIKNLDLLKEMDTLEKLVHVVDLPGNGQAPDDGQQPETQGMKSDGNGHGYA
jgi:hypothetical protein